MRWCRCPPLGALELAVVTEVSGEVEPSWRRSALDPLGFSLRCCCLPLRPAAFLISLAMFGWSAIQLVTAGNTARTLLSAAQPAARPAAQPALHYALLCAAVAHVLACTLLLVGIILRKHKMILIFLWFAVVHNLSHILLSLTVFAASVSRGAEGTKETRRNRGRAVLLLVISLLWNCLVFYFLKILNSFRMLVWVP